MKVAISIQHHGADALVDPRFGLGRRFVIADEAGSWQEVDNPAVDRPHAAAGVTAAELVVAAGAAAVLTGNVGPKAFSALRAAGVTVHKVGNGVSAPQALEALREGLLPALEAPTILGPWS